MPRKKLYTEEELLARRRAHYKLNSKRIVADNTRRNNLVIHRRKDLLSEYCCAACGSIDTYVIQWHHIDPSTKKFELWRTAWPEEKFWDEVLKCVPLCSNCHLKIHNNQLCLIPPKLR